MIEWLLRHPHLLGCSQQQSSLPLRVSWFPKVGGHVPTPVEMRHRDLLHATMSAPAPRLRKDTLDGRDDGNGDPESSCVSKETADPKSHTPVR